MRTRIDGKGGKHEPGSYFYRTPAVLCGCIVPTWLDFTFTCVFRAQKEVCPRAGKDHGRAQGTAHTRTNFTRAAPLPHGACRVVHHYRRHGVCMRGLLDILDYEVIDNGTSKTARDIAET